MIEREEALSDVWRRMLPIWSEPAADSAFSRMENSRSSAASETASDSP